MIRRSLSLAARVIFIVQLAIRLARTVTLGGQMPPEIRATLQAVHMLAPISSTPNVGLLVYASQLLPITIVRPALLRPLAEVARLVQIQPASW